MTERKPIYIRLSQVQRIFGIHRTTVNRMANRGEIIIHKMGRSAFVKVSDMEAKIEGTQPSKA